MTNQKLSPPDAVRVWRGFRSPALAEPEFFERLSTVFVPATVEMQTKIGLDVYIPTIPGGMTGKPPTVPDETAILFWNSQQTYHDGFKTLAVRAYTLTHGAVYTKQSRADFPLFFEGTMEENQPYYLVDRPADWMNGSVNHLVAGSPDGVTPAEFRKQVAGTVGKIRQIESLQGAVVCVGPNYIVYWELMQAGSNDESAGGIPELLKLVTWNVVAVPTPTTLPKGLWDVWPGMDIRPGDSFNMQFQRQSAS
ncbi:MAG: hypothetical protein MI923_27665 [Phycisphaerales bacterium]|nr:hypothetical protein [Phycisphaerales bacterium]